MPRFFNPGRPQLYCEPSSSTPRTLFRGGIFSLMKFFFAVAVLLFFVTDRVAAQSASASPNPCATVMPAGTRESIRAYVSAAPAGKTTSFADTVAITVHLVGNDNGQGYYPLPTLWKLLCNTNARFAQTGMYFQLKWPVRYIASSFYNDHDFSGGYDLITNENVPGTVNVYFVAVAAGACGYFMPGADGVVIANICAGVNSTTLTHELGHFMGLPHTFYGWEDGSTPASPERVTRTGPLANCATACDGFCDTDADFISERWFCPASAVGYDDLGARYHPDSSLYMSYALDACHSRFSGQQMGYMQYVLTNSRADLLQYAPQPYVALDTPSISYPADTMWTNDRHIRWAAVPGANYYHVSLKRASGFPIKDTLMTGTELLTTHPVADYNRYTVTVTPLASSNVCAAKPRVRTYTYSPASNPLLSVDGDAGALAGEVQLFPNPAGSEGWTIQVPHVRRGAVHITLFAPDGRTARTMQVAHEGGTLTQTISTNGLVDGLYFLRVDGEGLQWTGRAVLRK